MKRTPSNPSSPQSSPQSSASSKSPTKPPKSKSPGGPAGKKPKASTAKGTSRSAQAASASVAADPSLSPAGAGTGTGSATDVDVAQVIAPVASTDAVVPPLPQRVAAPSKQAQLITLLQSPSGASMTQMMALTGWQSHTVRGLISGTLRKRLGLTVQLEVKGGQRMYRIVKGRIAKSDIVEGVQP